MMRPVRPLAPLLPPASVFWGCSLEAATTHVPLLPETRFALLIRTSSPQTAEAIRTGGASSLSVPDAKDAAFVLEYSCAPEALGSARARRSSDRTSIPRCARSRIPPRWPASIPARTPRSPRMPLPSAGYG